MANSSGVKCVTPSNWLQVDPAWQDIYMPHEQGNGSAEWITFVMKVALIPSVPEHVRTLFSTAQGAIVYGLFFYPLMTLGCEQLMRVAETAARSKCELMGAPSMRKFSMVITWLVENKAIAQGAISHWRIIQELRNSGSHPRFQGLYNAAITRNYLDISSTAINELFT